MAQLLYANQYFLTSLNVGGGINASQTTGIIIADVTGVDTTKPGIACLSYTDPLNTDNAEWIEYTSINGSKEFVGVTRGQDGFSAKTHSNGAVISFPLSESHINRINEKLNGTDPLAGDLNLPTNGNIQVNSADPYKTIVLPAAAMSPTTTAGCAAISTVEAGTNDVDYKVLDFDQTTSENAFFHFNMPNSWDAGTLLASFIWTAASGTGTVTWALKGRAFADDDAIDQAYGTAQSVTDTLLTAGDIHISAETSAITLGGTPAAGQWCQFKVTRDIADTLNADARLIGIRIRYKLAQYSD